MARHHAAQSCSLGPGGQAKKASARSAEHAEEHPHLGDAITVEPVDEGVARLEGLVVARAAERGVLPLGGPPVGPDAELLIEVDPTAGHLEERAEHVQETTEPAVIAGHRVRAPQVEHEIVGEDRRPGCRDPGRRSPWSCGSRCRRSVDAHRSSKKLGRRCPRDGTKPAGAGTSGEPSIFEPARLSSSTDAVNGGFRSFSRCAPSRSASYGLVRPHPPEQGEPT